MQEYVLNLLAQKKNAEAAAYMESSAIPVIQEAQKELAQLIQSADAKEIERMAALQQTKRNAFILLISLGAVGVLYSAGVGTYMLRLCKNRRGHISGCF